MNEGTGSEKVQLSVVVPTYNEAARLADNIAKISSACEALGRTWELLIVNDGSSDDSAAIAALAATGDARVRLLSYPANRGRGYALATGFAASKGKYVISTESDVSYGTDIIGQLLHSLETTGAQIVVASPYMAGGRLENVPFARAFLSRWGNTVLRAALSAGIHTVTGMTRGYQGQAIRNMLLASAGKEIHLEILSKAQALGYRIGEIPAVLRWEPPRPGQQKRRSTFRPGRYIASHLLFSFGESPLLLFGSIGLVMLACGVAIGIYALSLSLAGTPVAGRPMVTGAVLLILFGVQIFLFCFLSIQNREIRNKLIRMESLLAGLACDRDAGSGKR